MQKWRFVADAVCPRCGSRDSVRLQRLPAGGQQRDCVECDFFESDAHSDAPSQGIDAAAGPGNLGRLGQVELLSADERPLRILDTPPPANDR